MEIDESGKKSGRGAYLCPDVPCWERALSKGLVDHALKTNITDDAKQALHQFCGALAKSSEE